MSPVWPEIHLCVVARSICGLGRNCRNSVALVRTLAGLRAESVTGCQPPPWHEYSPKEILESSTKSTTIYVRLLAVKHSIVVIPAEAD